MDRNINLNNYEFGNIPVPESIDTPNRHFAVLVSEIKKGHVRIPDFQRDFVWGIDQVEDLLDSVQRGFPIGSILLWETTEQLNEHDPLKLNHTKLPTGQRRQYILDGQQRLITLYEIIHDTLQIGKKRKVNYKVFYDLKNKVFQIYRKKDIEDGKEEPKIEDWFLPMSDLFVINYDTRSFQQNYKILDKFGSNSQLLGNYIDLFVTFDKLSVPAITTGQTLSVACKIFERLNTTGMRLSVADIMVATTYAQNFNLRDKLEDFNFKLNAYNFGLEDRSILQSISSCLKKHTTRDAIIESSSEIELKWDQTTNAIKLSIDFLKQHCSVPVSRFMPNEVVIAPLSYFFYKHGNGQLSSGQIKKLKRYFWLGLLSNRYVQSQDTRATEDIALMDKFLEGKDDANTFKYAVQIDENTIKNTEMSFGSAQAVAVLCFLGSKKPLEFLNNSPVILDSAFAPANLKQLHHIFPQNVIKSMFGKNDRQREYMNSVANISLISQTTNRDIWDKKPSVYFKEFATNNSNLRKSLESHLIDDLDSFGLTSDEFERFIDKRSKAIADAINAFVVELNS